jgi:hypothetical protein
MNKEEIDKLWEHNGKQLDKMLLEAGSVIRAVLRGSESNGPSFVRLHSPEEGGKSVGFEMVEGPKATVQLVCEHYHVTMTEGEFQI